ncbi:MAG TPA: hypothetical protein P5561_06860 [Candidatus Omnitrophota bacterium]|nr:hypothetical protein [Candidatus Omnitrophota bacterium]HRY86223.1 hypothetical protein [Candidatus Omnitrophota bacterium]
MRTPKLAALIFWVFFSFIPAAFALTAVEDSAEDLYWSDPMTVHDYKKRSDLHSISVSALATTELEFVRLGDGLIQLIARNKRSPISRSLDTLEYAYSKLPRIEPVRRFGQLWDALQLRQLSLSDARIAGSVLFGGSFGSITPMMQVRVHNLFVCIEDILYDIDGAVMYPFNWGISTLREKPTQVKSLGYAVDGLSFLRQHISSVLKYVNKKVVRASSEIVMSIEKTHDAMIRRKLKKQRGHLLIYSKMPVSVFEKNRSYFTTDKGRVSAGTLDEWYKKIFTNPELLPEDVRDADLLAVKITAEEDPSQEIIVAAEYRVWDETPRELKKYVITSDEFRELIKSYDAPSPAAPSAPEITCKIDHPL